MNAAPQSSSPFGGTQILLTASCCAALATLIPVALYQTKVLSNLPDPPGAVFDSERITSSAIAHPLGVPDSLLGLASFGMTLGLILLSKRSSIAKNLLGGKLTADAGVAVFNAGRQVVSFGKICSWCTGTAIATGVMAFAGRDIIAETWSKAASVADNA